MNKNDFLNELESDSCLFFRFLQALPLNYREKLICLVEGFDWEFYRRVMDRLAFNRNTLKYNCNGKKGVLKLRRQILENRKDLSFICFVDKDYEEQKIEGNLYMTPFYSVENFYLYGEKVEEFIRNEIYSNAQNHPLANASVSKILINYSMNREIFIKSSTLLNAWFSFCRKNTDSINKFQDFKASSLITYDLSGRLNLSINLDQLLNISHPGNIAKGEIKKEILEINERFLVNSEKYCRGKFFAQFVVSYLTYLKNISSKEDNFVGHVFYIRSNVSIKSFVHDLASYSQETDCLLSFLKNSA